MSTNHRLSKRISDALNQPRSSKGSKIFIIGVSLKDVDSNEDKEA